MRLTEPPLATASINISVNAERVVGSSLRGAVVISDIGQLRARATT
jgi:hypothetical protein